MNFDEQRILDKIRLRLNSTSKPVSVCDNDITAYYRKGRFTICLITTEDGEIRGMGATLRSPRDKDVPHIAEQIAFARAVRDTAGS